VSVVTHAKLQHAGLAELLIWVMQSFQCRH